MISFNSVDFSYTGKSRTLSDISLEILPGRNLGIVGESGSGKSTVMKLALGLYRPDSGEIRYQGALLNFGDKAMAKDYRRSVQAVFQDPFSSLDPRQSILRAIAEPLNSLGISDGKPKDWVVDHVKEALYEVGLDDSALARYPREFSGGQRQRIAIARALISRPKILLADEPVSSLDVTNRELILNLLQELGEKHELTIAVISHDLSIIAALCQEMVVMNHGTIVERGTKEQVLGDPRHPYTKRLLQAIPRLTTHL